MVKYNNKILTRTVEKPVPYNIIYTYPNVDKLTVTTAPTGIITTSCSYKIQPSYVLNADLLTEVGTLTLDNSTGLMTGFSSDNYLTYVIPANTTDLEFVIKFTTNTSVYSGSTNFFYYEPDDTSSDTFATQFGNHSSSYNLVCWNYGAATQNRSSITMSNSTTYTFKFVVDSDGNKNVYQIASDGTETNVISATDTWLTYMPNGTYTAKICNVGGIIASVDLVNSYIKTSAMSEPAYFAYDKNEVTETTSGGMTTNTDTEVSDTRRL